MGLLDNASNSAGLSIIANRMAETLKLTDGRTLTIAETSGRLLLVIQNPKENSGLWQETLSLILLLSTDGSISGKWVLS